jgi:hypothetical protein
MAVLFGRIASGDLRRGIFFAFNRIRGTSFFWRRRERIGVDAAKRKQPVVSR